MTNLTRWNPMRDLFEMRRMMDRFFDDFPMDTAQPLASPQLDVIDEEDHVQVVVNLPGIQPDDVNIEMSNGMLTISADVEEEKTQEDDNKQYTRRERYMGSYRRSLRVPDSLDADAAEAHFENGVLTLTLPKTEAAKPRRIPVSGATKVIDSGKK